MSEVTVCVVGLGYIGLPTAAVLANAGFRVFGCDLDERVVQTVNRGEIHIYEPDLDRAVANAITGGRLSASLQPQPADVYMICVPTPFLEQDGHRQPDISHVESAARAIAPLLREGAIVILESTSPVGTTERIGEILREAGPPIEEVALAYCPERVLPGKILQELVENDRIVGGSDMKAAAKVARFYRSFVRGEVVETDARSAELCKLVENSFRDANIAFANELSLLCEGFGVDPWNLISLANRHPRVNILQPGVGVGGHCIAVDPYFLISAQPDTARLLRVAREVNLGKTEHVIKSIEREAANNPGPIALLGAAFKPDIDDTRESPALSIADRLKNTGHDVMVVEPNVDQLAGHTLADFEEALERAATIAILVGHGEFRTPAAKRLLRDAGALDFCGALQ